MPTFTFLKVIYCQVLQFITQDPKAGTGLWIPAELPLLWVAEMIEGGLVQPITPSNFIRKEKGNMDFVQFPL